MKGGSEGGMRKGVAYLAVDVGYLIRGAEGRRGGESGRVRQHIPSAIAISKNLTEL